jgi:hypothetical protein
MVSPGSHYQSLGCLGLLTPAISFGLDSPKGEIQKSGLTYGMRGAVGKGSGSRKGRLILLYPKASLGSARKMMVWEWQVGILGSLAHFPTVRRVGGPTQGGLKQEGNLLHLRLACHQLTMMLCSMFFTKVTNNRKLVCALT